MSEIEDSVLDAPVDETGVDSDALAFLQGRRARQQGTLEYAQAELDKLGNAPKGTDFDALYAEVRMNARGRKKSARAPRYAAIVAQSKTGKARVETYLKALVEFSTQTIAVLDKLAPLTRTAQ